MTPAHEVPPTAWVITPDAEIAISGDALGVRILWRRDGSAVPLAPVEVPEPPVRWLDTSPRAVRWLGVSADGRVAASAHEGGVVVLFDPRSGRVDHVLPFDVRGEPDGPWTRLEVPWARWAAAATARATSPCRCSRPTAGAS